MTEAAAPASATTPQGRTDRRRLSRLTVATGVVAPVAFVVVFTLHGALTPGYSALREPVSFLEVGPYGWIEIADFVLLAVATIAFAAALAGHTRVLVPGASRAAAAGLLAASGVGYLLAAAFPPAAFDRPQTGVGPALHTAGFEIVFFGLGL